MTSFERLLFLQLKNLFVLGLGCLLFVSCAPDPTSPRYTVATIDGAKIKRKALNDRVNTLIEKIGTPRENLKEGQLTDLEWQCLDELINEFLIDRELEKLGASDLNERIDQELNQVRKRFESEEKFNQYLNDARLTIDGVRSEIRRQIGMQELLNKKYADLVEVDGEEIRDFYGKNPKLWNQPATVSVRHVLVRCPADATEEQKAEKKKKIEDARKRVVDGEKFEAVAIEVSEDPRSKSKGGVLMPFSKGRMVPAFEKVAFDLEVGALSEVFETSYGFHFLEVLDRKDSSSVGIDQVEDNIRKSLVVQKRVSTARKVLKDLRDESQVEIMIEEPSGGEEKRTSTGDAQ